MAAAFTVVESSVRANANTPSEGLLVAARDGDRSAMEEILTGIERRIYKLAYRLACDPVAAEDLAQESMLKICRHIGSYRLGSNFWGWICRIVINQAHDFRRAARPTVPETEDLPVPPNFDPVRSDKLRRVGWAMKSLSEKERTALVLIDIEGYSSKEAAVMLRCLPTTVRTRAAVARRKLRQRLSRHYPELQEGQ